MADLFWLDSFGQATEVQIDDFAHKLSSFFACNLKLSLLISKEVIAPWQLDCKKRNYVSCKAFEHFVLFFGPFPSCIQTVARNLINQQGRIWPWFHGGLDRAACNSILKKASNGTFLLRYSSLPGHLVVAYVSNDKTLDSIRNVLVYRCISGHGFCLKKQQDQVHSDKDCFSTLPELIKASSGKLSKPSPSPLYLTSEEWISNVQNSQVQSNSTSSNGYQPALQPTPTNAYQVNVEPDLNILDAYQPALQPPTNAYQVKPDLNILDAYQPALQSNPTNAYQVNVEPDLNILDAYQPALQSNPTNAYQVNVKPDLNILDAYQPALQSNPTNAYQVNVKPDLNILDAYQPALQPNPTSAYQANVEPGLSALNRYQDMIS